MFLNNKFSQTTSLLCYIVLVMLLIGCANIVPPNGGPKDETPPAVVSISPADSSLNSKPKKITIRTNKYMEVANLESQLHVSPYLPINPTVISYGKRIEIKLIDSLLQPNTTYKIALGNALVDNREQTPIANFEYIFSTGNYFDSLSINGKIINERTGVPDSGMHLFLYPADLSDSSIMHAKPAYIGKSKSDGTFNIDLLPNKAFKLLAVQDEDKNLMYTMPSERVAFYDGIIMPHAFKDSSIVMYSFVSAFADTIKGGKTDGETKDRFAKANTKQKSAANYQVMVDTNLNNRVFELKDTLKIIMHQYAKKVDQSRIYLSYDNNGIEVEAIYQMKTDSNGIYLISDWQENKVYTLRLMKGWSIDIEDKEFAPDKLQFRTRKKEDYATIKVNIDSNYLNKNYLIEIKKDNELVYLNALKGPVLFLEYLHAGVYQLALIEDTNNDGKWTPGDFLLRRQSEKMLHHFSTLPLRAGWENEVDFKAKTMNDAAVSDDKFNIRK